MRIAELSPEIPDAAATTTTTSSVGPESSPHYQFLRSLESSILEAESLSPSSSPATAASIASDLRRHLKSSPRSPSSDVQLRLWKLSFRLWNSCVDLSNSSVSSSFKATSPFAVSLAELRHCAADLLEIAGAPPTIPSAKLKIASLFYKTGQAWQELSRDDRATVCFETATDQISGEVSDETKQLMLDLNIARAQIASSSSDHTIAIGLLNRSKTLVSNSASAHTKLAEEFLRLGKHVLRTCHSTGAGAGELLSEALDLCEKGTRISRHARESKSLAAVRGRCLRFLAAERLQEQDFEGALRCVRVLRESNGGEDELANNEHAAVSFVAMKAWIGVGRLEEAERELRAMVARADAPEAACVAAAETFVGVAGAEKAPSVVAALVGRCRSGGAAAPALRLVKRVLEGENVGKGRARVVAEITADEKVVALFENAAAARERGAMHALLWNCGAEYFQLKDYETSAEMFEKSMLYLPLDEENRLRRSNCLRVLCLCHLGLNQLDRAQEFIDEADKLDHNIKCAFLKFKIYLQKKDEEKAIKQMQSMVNCVDFNPEFLSLSTHEAIACKAIPVAVASLSFLLNLYTPGKSMSMPEVAVLRNLITLLNRVLESAPDILKFMRLAQTRMVEVGTENFFGAGAVGNRELSWFAGNSWNMGLRMGKQKNYELCAEFLELSSEFYGALKTDDSGNNGMVCKCLILGVGAIINVEEQKKISLPPTTVKKAMEMLGKASKLLASLSSSSNEESSLLFLHTCNTYQLLNRLDSDTRSQQLQLIKSFVSSKANSPENLLQLGLAASTGVRPHPEAAELLLNACLTSLLAGPSPDYHMVSICLRKLTSLAGLQNTDVGDGNNDRSYAVYEKAYKIIVGLDEGQYPIEEGKWLATTAWNKSGMAIRFRQVNVARRWMKIGLDLARRIKGMEKYIGIMEECCSNFEKMVSSDRVERRKADGEDLSPLKQ